MRFRSLYRYSYGKSPKDLRPAVVACKLALALIIVATILVALAVSLYFYNNYHSTKPSANSSKASTPARHQEELPNHSSSSSSSSSLAHYLADYSVPLCLIAGAVLFLLTLASICYAHLAYRRYLQSRLVSYQLVNRSFDQLKLEQLAKVHVRQPIVSKQNGATVLVPKTSPVPEWLKQSAEVGTSNRSKFANWARSKWTRTNLPATTRNINNNPKSKRPISKEMTI